MSTDIQHAEPDIICDQHQSKSKFHRYPFLLVDRVVEWEHEKYAVGYKNVTYNDNFFPGHFPERPIMPGEDNWFSGTSAAVAILVCQRDTGTLLWLGTEWTGNRVMA